MIKTPRSRCQTIAILAAMALSTIACGTTVVAATPSPAGAHVYFIGLKDGDAVKSPLTLHFGLSGMGVAPAGVVMENTGHHHLFIDTPLPADSSQPIPAIDGKVMHFGKGQTETTITLTPGKHTLQLELGDAPHVPHSPAVASEVITVKVVP